MLICRFFPCLSFVCLACFAGHPAFQRLAIALVAESGGRDQGIYPWSYLQQLAGQERKSSVENQRQPPVRRRLTVWLVSIINDVENKSVPFNFVD